MSRGGMFIVCNDGPAAGATFTVTRCAQLVRVVIDGKTGKRDILNEPDDEPTETEAVYWYRWDGGRVHGHFCTRGRGCYEQRGLDHAPEIVGMDDRRRTRQLVIPGTAHTAKDAERQAAENQQRLLGGELPEPTAS